LADNAIKFSERGEITIRFRIASETSTHLSLHCSVEDEGMGIPEADLQRIFTLFEQGDGSSTRRHGGTGLGLALCRKLVHLMNGEIGVTSRPGVGSTFHFTVRLTPVAPMH
ncbi:MAG: hybrid sensor histidine kinase/response regulator, partial [Zoogloea sp.]|nr:hybrid sensor histidine kinase/response regulator [Zoogloea sp.]